MNTEEKIKQAAKIVFHNKGYAASTTRDIAKEANLNLALINYYFKSKEKLFEIIMFESMGNFMQSLMSVFNNSETDLKQKTEEITKNYLNLLSKEPDLPIFILSEIRNGGLIKLIESLGIKNMMRHSTFYKQIEDEAKSKGLPGQDPTDYIINLISLSVFPFIAKPMLGLLLGLEGESFATKMEDRKKSIPQFLNKFFDKN